MQSEDLLGLVAYNYEPEYSEIELESLERALESADVSDIEEQDGEWCDCENCSEMASRDENICCRSSELCCGSLEDNQCITQHKNLGEIVLNPVILEVAFIQIMAFKGQTGRAPDELNNRQSRLTAYRQFVCWMLKGERVGKGKRVVIPSCVVTAIRNRFPDASNIYTGFRAVLDSISDLFM